MTEISDEAIEAATTAVLKELAYSNKSIPPPYSKLARDCARAALQTAAPLMGPQWQSMESAPRDGTEIDVWNGGERVTDVFWSDKRNAWCRQEYETGFGFVAYTIQPPTHWMPRPAAATPPESQSAGGKD